VQQLNQTATAFFGRSVQQVLGATPEQICPAPKAAALSAWLREVAAAGAARQYEWRDQDNDDAGAGSDSESGVDVGPGDGLVAHLNEASSVLQRVWDCRIAPLDDGDGQWPKLLLVATDVTEQRAAEQARLKAAIDQRELLVREVHHRIKNNLQGVAGLLQQNATRHPEIALVLSEAVGQVQAIAQVYGLQVGASGPLGLADLLRAIALSVQRTFGRAITVQVADGVPHLLPEAEAIPLALTVNELFTNAIKHGTGDEVRCHLAPQGVGVLIRIAGRGSLAPEFDLSQVRGAVSGLGLVRALLPRRSASLSLAQVGDEVVAEITLQPPSVRLPAPPSSGVPDPLSVGMAPPAASVSSPSAGDQPQSGP